MHPQAILDFDATIDRNPFVGAPYAARGQSFVATNQYDKAIEDFNAALNVDNRDADSWAWRGVAYERKGDKAAGGRELPARARPRQRQRDRPAGPRRASRAAAALFRLRRP